MNIAVYPGSFDPITLGHLNIIRRSAALFDTLYVCVMKNSDKKPLFSTDERVRFIERAAVRYKNVKVESSEELLVKYMQSRSAKIIIKGLRAVTDFDKEFQIALINRKLDNTIETLFIPSSEKYTYISSSAVKEMARYGDDLKTFVPHEIIGDVIYKIESEGLMFK
ncbi:MAG: pantetheine-phosphate adenylyltransferase [Oscillospiraceae bacterium]|nr:pantetheine-phosphate adenylyltransferase [Oscillospiraceae bacterium]